MLTSIPQISYRVCATRRFRCSTRRNSFWNTDLLRKKSARKSWL